MFSCRINNGSRAILTILGNKKYIVSCGKYGLKNTTGDKTEREM